MQSEARAILTIPRNEMKSRARRVPSLTELDRLLTTPTRHFRGGLSHHAAARLTFQSQDAPSSLEFVFLIRFYEPLSKESVMGME